jgi:hypothetical protein
VPDILDSVTWQNLEALNGPVLGYVDGSVSGWPSEAFVALGGRVAGVITVLADERHGIFDAEMGNAGNDAVAAAVANRSQDRLASTCYTNKDNLYGLTQTLRRKGIYWTDMQFWPEPGCYLWAAAPGTTPGRLPSWCPVSPVAVQDRWLPGYDVSTTFTTWPRVTAPPDPPKPQPVLEDDDVILVRDSAGHVVLYNGRDVTPVESSEDMAAFQAAGIKVANVSDAQWGKINR